MNSEEEKSWNPFDDDSMDENVSKAFEEMQKHPDKWMKKLEEEMDSEGSSSSEEEEEEEESEESEEKVEEKVEEEEESEESEESAIESEEEEEEEDMNEEEEEEDKEREMSEKEIQRQQKREQLKQQGKDEKQAIHKLNPALSMYYTLSLILYLFSSLALSREFHTAMKKPVSASSSRSAETSLTSLWCEEMMVVLRAMGRPE